MIMGMPERGLRPASELAQGRPHGDRMRYMGGCRCTACRRANSDYECARLRARKNGDWNGIVSATRARGHLRKLRKAGIGRRSVAIATDIGETILAEINTGKKKRIRARTERLILAVTPACAADGAYVSAAKTWQQIRQLLNEGFTKVRIAEAIGQKRALQLGKTRVTVRNAAAVDRLWRKYMTEAGL